MLQSGTSTNRFVTVTPKGTVPAIRNRIAAVRSRSPVLVDADGCRVGWLVMMSSWLMWPLTAAWDDSDGMTAMG